MPRKKLHEDRTAYKNQFIAQSYDRINLTVPKGQKKVMQDLVKTFHPRISVNKYINLLIEQDLAMHEPDETIDCDNEKKPPTRK